MNEFDREVETVWKKQWDWVEAIPYFNRGGLYVDSGEKGGAQFDKPYVVPLLKRTAETHQLKWMAVVDKKAKDNAVALVAELPADPKAHAAIRSSLEKEQAGLKGDLLLQMGKKWISVDFLNEEDAKFLMGE